MIKTYFLPNSVRKELKKIWGIPIFGKKGKIKKKFQEFCQKKKIKKVITVGDYCSRNLPSDIKIFDGKIERKRIKKLLNFSLKCENPAGTIQNSVWKVLKKAIQEKKNVFIEGEEDLLVIPAVLLSGKGSVVVYGFPKKGICLIEVSRTMKKNIKELLKKFHSSPQNNLQS